MVTGTDAQTKTLAVGETVVHPAHGLCRVVAMGSQEVAGETLPMYSLTVEASGMTVMVPSNSLGSCGIRAIMAPEEVDRVFEVLRDRRAGTGEVHWHKRMRCISDLLRSGRPDDVAEGLRELYILRAKKKLSYMERRLFDLAKGFLSHEMAAACGESAATFEQRIEAVFEAVVG